MPAELTSQPARLVRSNPSLRTKLLALCDAFYSDPVAVLESSLDRAHEVWCARDGSGRLDGFFCVSTHALGEPVGDFTHIEYGGLAVTGFPQRRQGVLTGFLTAWRDGVRSLETASSRRLMCGITCHDFILEVADGIFAGMQPRPDGTFDDEGLRLARAVRRHVFGRDPDPARPFHLEAVTASRYREEFKAQLPPSPRMEARGIDEERGDRLLFVFAASDR